MYESRSGDKWNKVKIFQFFPIYSSELSAFAYALHTFIGAFPLQIEGKSDPSQNFVAWCYQLGQVLCLCWQCVCVLHKHRYIVINRHEMITTFKINCDKSVGMWLSRWKLVFISHALQLDGWASQNIWYLVWSWPTAGDELVGGSEEGQGSCSFVNLEESFLEGDSRSMCFTHQPNSPLLTLFFHTCLPN